MSRKAKTRRTPRAKAATSRSRKSSAARIAAPTPARKARPSARAGKAASASVLDAKPGFGFFYENVPIGIAHTTTEGRILGVNRKLCDILGYSEQELLRLTTRDLTHPDDRDRQDQLRLELLAGARQHFSGEKRYIRSDGKKIWVNRTVTLAGQTASGGPYLIQVFEDISERKFAEERLERANRARRVLAECHHALAHAASEPELFSKMCRIAVETGGYIQGWIGLATGDPARPVYPAAHAGYGSDAPMTHSVKRASDGRYQGLAERAFSSGETRIERDILNDPQHERKRERALQLGYQSTIALPLRGEEGLLGVLVLHARELDAFDNDEIGLLTGLADDIAFGIVSLRTRAAHMKGEAALRESEQRFRETFEQAAVGISRVDLNGILVDCNQKFCDMLGYAKDELLGKAIRVITHPDDYGQGAQYRAQLTHGAAKWAAGEKRFVRKDGTVMWARRTMSVACDDAGNPQYVISVVEDITERKELERRFELIFNHAAVGMSLGSLDGRYTLVNQRFADMVGYSREELAGMPLQSIAHPGDRVESEQLRQKLLSGEVDSLTGERRYVRKDGSVIWASRTLSLLRNAAREPLYFIGVGEDITERKELEQRYRETFDQAAVGIVHTSLDGRYLKVNQKFCEMLGYSESELVGRAAADFTHPEDGEKGRQYRQLMWEGKLDKFSEEKRYLRKDGSVIWTNRTVSLARDASGKPLYFIRVIEDITERKQAAERYRATFDNAPVGIMHTDVAEDRILHANPKLCEMLGHTQDELLRMTTDHILHPDYVGVDRPKYREKLLKGELDSFSSERLLVRKDGSTLWVTRTVSLVKDAASKPLYFIRIIEDISERKQAEEAQRASEATLRAAFEQAAVGMALRDIDPRNPRWLRVNQKLCDILGYTCEELLQLTSVDLTPPEERRVAIDYNEQLLRGEMRGYSREKRYLRKDGQIIWVNISLSAVRGPDGRPTHIISIIQDVTDRKNAEAALQESEEQFRQLAGNIPQAFWITDALQRNMVYVSPAYERITGRSIETMKADARDWLEGVHEGDRERVRLARRAAADGKYDEVFRVVRPDGAIRWIHDRAFPVHDAEGKVQRIAGIAEDVTEREQAQERLLHLAHYDSLTNLPNRELFYDRLRQALNQARRNNWVMAVMFLDLDRFKNVNDTLGHSAGDQLLRKVAQRLADCIRSGDTVGRLSGDEFAVVLSDLTGPIDAGLVAQKIMAAIAKPFDLEGKEVFISTSIGITLYPADSQYQEALIRNADAAMYRAKELGRNGYQFYTPEMSVHAPEKLELESSLRHALERDEFRLYYQPKTGLESSEITGLEALLRWRHPERGIMSPGEFMPMLEETGLIVEAGEWVMRAACAQIKAWQEAGIKPVPIAVNLSARQFQAQYLGSTVSRILEETGIEHGLVELEITEGSLVDDTEKAAETLAFLNSLGVRVAIDDFGTGYSSLSYIKRFPLDALKIDSSFVRDITTDADDAAITRAIITMAHSMNLKVIAEGVETEAQLDFLSASGCDEIQGYYFSRPLSAEQCTELLQIGKTLHRPVGGVIGEPPAVLLVNDDEDALALLKQELSREDYPVFAASNAREGLAMISQHNVKVVISDFSMTSMSGIEFLRRVKSLYPDTVCMIISGHADYQTVTEAVNKGEIYRFVAKNWDSDRLRSDIQEGLMSVLRGSSAASVEGDQQSRPA